jgi:hypothetical protein
MKFIYLIKSFDPETWTQYQPIAFETREEAETYCKTNEVIHNIIYSYEKISVGKIN